MEEKLLNVTCLISGEIFLNPVIAEDEHYYEYECITEWFKTHSTSPMCGINIGNKLIESNKKIREVNNFMKKYPNNNQFKSQSVEAEHIKPESIESEYIEPEYIEVEYIEPEYIEPKAINFLISNNYTNVEKYYFMVLSLGEM